MIGVGEGDGDGEGEGDGDDCGGESPVCAEELVNKSRALAPNSSKAQKAQAMLRKALVLFVPLGGLISSLQRRALVFVLR